MENVTQNSEPFHFDRIREASTAEANREIDQQMRRDVERHSGSPEAIEKRLAQLDREWDVDRALMANFAVVAMAGLLLGAFRDKRWLALPAVQMPFLFYHAANGWCPPMPVFRKLGFRSRQEIEEEKLKLKHAGAKQYSGNTASRAEKGPIGLRTSQ